LSLVGAVARGGAFKKVARFDTPLGESDFARLCMASCLEQADRSSRLPPTSHYCSVDPKKLSYCEVMNTITAQSRKPTDPDLQSGVNTNIAQCVDT